MPPNRCRCSCRPPPRREHRRAPELLQSPPPRNEGAPEHEGRHEKQPERDQGKRDHDRRRERHCPERDKHDEEYQPRNKSHVLPPRAVAAPWPDPAVDAPGDLEPSRAEASIRGRTAAPLTVYTGLGLCETRCSASISMDMRRRPKRDQSNRCASKRSAAPVPVSSRRLGIALPNGVAPLPVERGASTRGSLGIGRSPVAVRPVVTPAAAHPAAPEEKPHRAERDQQPEPVCLEKFHGPALRQHLGRFASAPRHLLQPAPRPSFVVRIRSPAQPTSSAGDRTKARCRPRRSQP